MKVHLIVGSVRDTRVALHVAEWIKNSVTVTNADVEIIDLKAWNLPFYTGIPPLALNRNYNDALQQKWSEKILEADAFILISPEYNHGYSPALKNALDYLGSEWKSKPVAFVSYGGSNGSRSIEQIRSVTTQLGLIDLNLCLEIRDIFTRTKDQPFEGTAFEAQLVNDYVAALVNTATKLQA